MPRDAKHRDARGSVDRLVVAVLRAATDLDQALYDLVRAGDQLTEIDGLLLAPGRQHVGIASDQFDELLHDLEHHGRGYPHGRPVLRLAGDDLPKDTWPDSRLRRIA